MKILIHGIGLLLASAALVALKVVGADAYIGGAGFGILSAAMYFFLVFFIPRRVVRSMQRKRPAPEPADAESVVPDIKVPAEEPAPRRENKYRPIHRDVVGYQLAVFVLVVLVIGGAVGYSSRSSEVERLQSELDAVYHDAYEEGYAAGETVGYESGVHEAIESLDLYSCFSSGFHSGVNHVRNGRDLVLPPDIEDAFSQWLSDSGYPD